MFVLLSSSLLPKAFFVSIVISLFSVLLMLHPRVSLNFVRIHVGISAIPPLVALLNLVVNHTNRILGPWHLDSLAWLTALFVLTIGLVVQRYSMRHLLGDRYYRKYFALLTLTTSSASVAWLSDDLRWLLACWGISLLGLTLLISLNREWKVAGRAAALSLRLFALSWFFLLIAITWLTHATGHWQLSIILTNGGLLHLGSWQKASINLLFVFAVVIPAAQWPFQRWLLDSVVAPTPVSAVMHAGVVNAGGIILTRFAPLFHSSLAQVILIILSSVSILMGTGIIMVQVDYKRQLVGSTIAQMGFMLIQCALGAYMAAIIHAVLHGLFKSALFLQAGSAVHHDEQTNHTTTRSAHSWIIAGYVLGILVGIGFWFNSTGTVYQLISALILGYSVSFAWKQLVAFGSGGIGRMVGFSLMAGAAIVFSFVPAIFYRLLHETVQQGIHPPTPTAILALFILLLGISFGTWLTRHRFSTSFAILYLWLVQLSEPHRDSVESHPHYLALSLSEGGNSR
jgi:NAD(P)H-quinone oxidoreductase subunit 5